MYNDLTDVQSTERNNITKDDFDSIIKSEILTRAKEFLIDGTAYFNTRYSLALQEKLACDNCLGSFARELVVYSSGMYKMCSVASSSRLAYLHFRDKVFDSQNAGSQFECNLQIYKTGEKITPISRAIAHPDVLIVENKKKTYYECKCHEIFDTKKDILSGAYEKRLEELGITIKKTPKNELLIDYSSLKGQKESVPQDLKIWMIDVKQMICHLLGIIDNKVDDEEITLKYVFFRPNDKRIRKVCEELLDEEWKAIEKSVIGAKAKEHHITLEMSTEPASPLNNLVPPNLEFVEYETWIAPNNS